VSRGLCQTKHAEGLRQSSCHIDWYFLVLFYDESRSLIEKYGVNIPWSGGRIERK
jgi:hypothetical protein